MALATLASIALAGPASGHTFLLDSDPLDGAELDASPPQIRLRFSTDVTADLSELILAAEDGAEIPLANRRVEAPHDLVVDVPRLPPGVYHLRWRVAAPTDLHELSGSIVFGVGRAPPPSSGTASAAPFQPLPVSLARVGELLGFAALLGAAVVGRVAVPVGGAAAAGRRLVTLGVLGAALAIAAGGIRIMLVTRGLPGRGGLDAAPVLAAAWATAAIAMAGLAACLVAGLLPRRRWPARSTHLLDVAGVVLGVVAGVALVQGGHLSTEGPLGGIVAAAHLLAACTWVGGLTALALVLPALAVGHAGAAGAIGVRRAVRRFGLVALPAAVIAAGSGLAAAGLVLPSPAILAGSFATLLAAKVGFAIAVTVLGLRNARSVGGPVGALAARPVGALRTAGSRWRARWRRPWRPRLSAAAVTVEVAAAVAVVAFGAALAGASSEVPYRPAAIPASTASTRADDLVVALTVRPARPGPNFLSVAVLDTRRPVPGPVTGVELAVSDGTSRVQRVAARASLGQWVSVVDLQATGRWSGEIVVHRDGLDDARATVRWELAMGSAGPGARPFRAAAGLAGISLAGVGLAVVAWTVLPRDARPHRPRRAAAHVAAGR
ncbi:MAG TPA: copper resistance CopC family protein [Candidatus Limnocylindrales bacterium]